jgi:hypothetical protein
MRCSGTQWTIAAFVVGLAGAMPVAFAADTPVGLRCAAGATLLIEANVLTCKSLVPRFATPTACKPPPPVPGRVTPPVVKVVREGADTCPGSIVGLCGAGFVLRTDYRGQEDMCVSEATKASYQAPTLPQS